MIPISLNVRNFMSYTDVHEPLRFDGIHVAVLSGDNGHGKSALLDAITWALWGRARARAADELIHAGASEMEVEFEFALAGEQYRVIRKRQRRGKQALADLQFAILADDGYRPLTERSLLETERCIERTLGMSYETFTNSSFLQQGRADSFTTNSPAERKRILAEILELGTYDELEMAAKEAFKEREAQLNDERRLAQAWEEEIAHRAAYQVDVERYRAELAVLEARVGQLDAETTAARERVIQLEALQRQVNEIEVRLHRYAVETSRLSSTLDERKRQRQEVQTVLARAAVIECAAAELELVRGQLAVADAKQQEFLPLERARAAAIGIVAAAQARLEGEVAQRERRLGELRLVADRLPALEADLRRTQQVAATLDQLAHQHEELRKLVARCREESAEKRTINAQLKQDMLELKARIDELEQLAVCPSCQRPMEPSHKRQLSEQYATQGRELRDQFRTYEAAYRQLESLVQQRESQLAQLGLALQDRDEAQRRLVQSEGAVSQARQAQRELATLRQELAERQQLLREQRFAPEARQEVAALERRVAALGYDEAEHTVLRARAAELGGVDRERQLLEQARFAAEQLTSQIAELESSLERLQTDGIAEQRRREELCAQTRGLDDARDQLRELDIELAQARRNHGETRDQVLYAQNKLDHCIFLERKQKESLARQDVLRREQGVYGELAHAFGRRGVQAMIIETAIPEIEDEANRILARMTDGRMHVRFETQREVRSGAGTIETLDIKISDELGTRSYELFSGGESFRVNFAIRIALSRLLAHRAGTKLQTLIVDEGFGSQDQEGRERIVQAIQAIQPEFEKILVITHVDDLRDRFPVRIEVTKTPQGSTYSLQ